MYSIETIGLSHRFPGGELALSDIGIRVGEGDIYGFLGPNGAGKTTTLKLILGLLKKQSGEINVFGSPFEKDRIGTLKRLGSLIESPSIYEHLTAEENLRLMQKVYRCPTERIPYVLGLVGLSGARKKRAGKFSLGMKQRLGIAIAMLHDPKLLILDEPTNGLDPNGILEIRELLRRLNSEKGLTILISSHMLSEIEKLVSHVGIIHKGRMLFQGKLDDLMLQRKKGTKVSFNTSNNHDALEIFSGLSIPAKIENGKILIPATGNEKIAEICRSLVEKEIGVYEVSEMENDLEKIFFEVITE